MDDFCDNCGHVTCFDPGARYWICCNCGCCGERIK